MMMLEALVAGSLIFFWGGIAGWALRGLAFLVRGPRDPFFKPVNDLFNERERGRAEELRVAALRVYASLSPTFYERYRLFSQREAWKRLGGALREERAVRRRRSRRR